MDEVEAATVALRGARAQSSNFAVNRDEEFEVEIFVSPQGQSVTGVSVYLSFDERFLELIDANPGLNGVQPFANGPWLPDGWQIFDNDTHGDPGNRFINFQIDYAGQVLNTNAGVQSAGVAGVIRFKALQLTNTTRIVFDNVRPVSRVTQVTVASGGRHVTLPFTAVIPAEISIVGGPVISNSLPDIQFLLGETDDSLDLDDYVEDANDPDARLEWSAADSSNLTIEIDPVSHVVTFEAVGSFLGSETIEFTVADPQNNSASQSLQVNVVAAPEITFSGEPLRLRVNQESRLDLNAFVTDPDDPTLSGIQWELTQTTDLADVRLDGSELIVSGQTPARTSVVLAATDADGNRGTAELVIEIAPIVDGPTVDFSTIEGVIATNDGTQMLPPELDLDDFVFDFDFAVQDVVWTADGNITVQVDIDSGTHLVNFRSDSGATGAETVTFIATNPAGQSGADTLQVVLIGPEAPPIVAEIPPIVLDFGQEQTVDLKEFVVDLDSTPDQIVWEASGNEQIQITLDNNGIATLFAEAVVSEVVTFTATDPQANPTSTQVSISVRPPNPPEIRDFPSAIQVRHGEVTEGFNLDDFVTDSTTPDAEIEWTASGFDVTHLQVTIDANRRVFFTPLPDWRSGSESVIFTATNKAGRPASATTTVTAIFAPVVSLSGSITIEEGTQDRSLDLDDHVEDNDTPISAISWAASGFTQISVTIDLGNHKSDFRRSHRRDRDSHRHIHSN